MTDSTHSSPSATLTPAVTVTHEPFGKLPDGTEIQRWTLGNSALELSVITFGARVTSLKTGDRKGQVADIALGYATLEQYLADHKTFVGAIAGRYANRLAHGRFTLNGTPHQITVNDGANTLHGGIEGFDRRPWTAAGLPNGVELTLVSPDGDQGFPGQLTARVRYTLHGNQVHIELLASTQAPTVINLTNHTYFNLAGEGSGPILDHLLQLEADHITPVDATLIPTGEFAPVAGTPFDFTTPTAIGERIQTPDLQLQRARGYDHNFVLRHGKPASALLTDTDREGHLHLAATAHDPSTGRTLEVRTTEPGIQFYSGNFLDGSTTGPGGRAYEFRTGFCLETQHFPDSPNHPAFPSTLLNPGEHWRSLTTWTLTAK